MKVRKLVAISVLVLGTIAANDVAPTNAELEAMYDKAYRAFDAANYVQALKELDAIDTRKPDLAASQNLRGVIYTRQGIYDKAEAALSEALRLDPKFWNARFNLAEIPFLKKEWPDARKRFQELLTSNASELQGEATQLIQYKILLTYLLEGNDPMVDAILAKFELSPDTPAVHYANAAISLHRQNAAEAKNWMTAAEKNFSTQLNKLFAESLYEVGWLEKQPGQQRAALQVASPEEREAKTKAMGASAFDRAQQAYEQRDFDGAGKLAEQADTAQPNQPAILNLRGAILLEQQKFDDAEAFFRKALKIDPKFREAQFNLAEVPFRKHDYAQARDRFQSVFKQIPGGEKNQAAQLINFKVFLTYLLEGKDSRAQKMMEQFQFSGDTPALYYAQAAWEFKHEHNEKANDWITSARKIYPLGANAAYAAGFYDLGWLKSAAVASTPAPSAAAVASAQNESAAPAIEPSPIPGAESKSEENGARVASAPVSGTEAATGTVGLKASEAVVNPNPASVLSNAVAAGTPARSEDVPSVVTTAPSLAAVGPVQSIAPVSSTPGMIAQTAAARAPASAEPPFPPVILKPETSAAPAQASASVAPTAQATPPATVLAPARVAAAPQPSFGERLDRWTDPHTLGFAALLLTGLGIIAWVLAPFFRRHLAVTSLGQRPAPVTGPDLPVGTADHEEQPIVVAKQNQFSGGPRRISVQLKASEPSLRRAVIPSAKRAVEFAPPIEAATFSEPVVTEEAGAADFADFAESSVGPVIEQSPAAVERAQAESEDRFAPLADNLAAEASAIPSETADVVELPPEPLGTWSHVFAESALTEAPVEEPLTSEPMAAELASEHVDTFELTTDAQQVEAVPEVSIPAWEVPEATTLSFTAEQTPISETEPVAQGQPVPYQTVSTPDTSDEAEHEVIWSDLEAQSLAAPPLTVDIPVSIAERSSETADHFTSQPTTIENMPETLQTPTAPVIRTPAAASPSQPMPAAPQAAAGGHTAVQITLSCEIASMQLTPTFKMGALQLRPMSKIVTMRLASAQQQQQPMNLQVNFEIAKVQPAPGGLGQMRLNPSQQQRPATLNTPSFNISGLQLVSGFEAAPVQLTPSQQGQASVHLTAAFQISTVEFSPTFDIAGIILNSTSKMVSLQLPGAGPVPAENAPIFEITNVQLASNGEIGMLQLNPVSARRA